MSQHYETRLLRVLEYMHTAAPEALSLDHLAEVAAMSRFHFHRVFHAMKGETCAQAVRRIRLHKAACQLVETTDPLDVIAVGAGYTSVPAFSRSFRARYGMPPGQFREQGLRVPDLYPQKPGVTEMFDVKIATRPDCRMAYLPHQGDYNSIGTAFEKVAMLCSTRGLWPQVQSMVGVYYDDPDATETAALRSLAGVLIKAETPIAAPLEEMTLQGARTAVLRFKGPYSGLRTGYQYLFGPWLAQSGEDLRDQPCYEIYLNDPSEVAPEDLLTDICLPLK